VPWTDSASSAWRWAPLAPRSFDPARVLLTTSRPSAPVPSLGAQHSQPDAANLASFRSGARYPYSSGIYATFGRASRPSPSYKPSSTRSPAWRLPASDGAASEPGRLVAGLLAVPTGPSSTARRARVPTRSSVAVTVAVALALAPACPGGSSRSVLGPGVAAERRGTVRLPVMLADVCVAFVAAPTLLVSRRSPVRTGRDGRGGALRTSGGFNLCSATSGRGRRQPVHLGTARGSGACAHRPSDRCRRGGPTLRQRACRSGGTSPRGHPAPLEEAPLDLDRRELPNTGDIEWETSQSALFRWRVLPLRLGSSCRRGSGRASPRRECEVSCSWPLPVAIPLATSGNPSRTGLEQRATSTLRWSIPRRLAQAPSDPGLRAAVVGFFRRYGWTSPSSRATSGRDRERGSRDQRELRAHWQRAGALNPSGDCGSRGFALQPRLQAPRLSRTYYRSPG